MVLVARACSSDDGAADPYAAQRASIGGSLAVLGWNMSVANLRFDGDYVLFDVEASPSRSGAPHAEPEDLAVQPVSAPSLDRLTGTVCIGPQRDQVQVRGVYVYSPRDRMAGTTTALPAAFPVGLPQTKDNDTGLSLTTTSVDAFRADRAMLDPAALVDKAAFTGGGYMLLGLGIGGVAQQYSDVSRQRGGPTMVLVLPDSSRDAVQLKASMCTQGEINAALLYATVSLVGTNAELWTMND